ncbi:MAG: tRNA (adenosine(37)-N6)-dimethylallyltransferase MiaA [Anaerolineae bacterium]|nr:tRNA (adenosine(37)-N6)-dimethylallyltransferase MiaA [Anaerolineae bacterium]
MSQDDPFLVVVVGPTGVGKTALAVDLAQALHGEIVSADSRQVYRYMNIGTAKPTLKERSQARHHLIDIIDPDEDFGLATFQELAYDAMDTISNRARLPFLVGGTGQYVRAVVEGWRIPRVLPDEALRARLYEQADQNGYPSLYQDLLALDPAAEQLIDARNVRRVVRALEVCLKSGRPFSEQRGKASPPYRIVQVGLTMAREALYDRIDARIEGMIAAGLVQEIEGLLAKGYAWTLPSMSSLGYIQLKGVLDETASLDECVAAIKKETRRFIRQQYNWFRLDNPRIRWFDAGDSPVCEVLSWLHAQRLF